MDIYSSLCLVDLLLSDIESGWLSGSIIQLCLLEILVRVQLKRHAAHLGDKKEKYNQ